MSDAYQPDMVQPTPWGLGMIAALLGHAPVVTCPYEPGSSDHTRYLAGYAAWVSAPRNTLVERPLPASAELDPLELQALFAVIAGRTVACGDCLHRALQRIERKDPALVGLSAPFVTSERPGLTVIYATATEKGRALVRSIQIL